MYSVLGSQKWNQVGHGFWNRVMTNEVLPGRSIDSMKSFWKQYSETRLEDFLIESFETGRDYCLSHKKVPDPSIEQSFRNNFAQDFIDWEERRAAGLIPNLDNLEYEELTQMSYLKETPQQLVMSQRTMDDSSQVKQSFASSATTKPFEPNCQPNQLDALLASNLEKADFTNPVTRTKQGVTVKSVSKSAIGEKRTFYNAFSGAGELAFTLIEYNPGQTLEKMGEQIASKRFKTYVPRD